MFASDAIARFFIDDPKVWDIAASLIVTIFFGQYIFLQVTDAAGQCLFCSKDSPAAKIKQVNLFVQLFTYLKVRLYLHSVRIGNLRQRQRSAV